jgi:molybdopterin/thiamine biosynthesis adenylyltransferase
MSDTRFRNDLQGQVQVEQGLRTIRLEHVHGLSQTYRLTVRQVEVAALELGVVPLRYQRNIGTAGIEGQATLLRSTAAVVGLGGLGGYVTEALARMGIGRLILIDGDVFDEHNLNRQLLSSQALLGAHKTEAARQRVGEINSAVEVLAYPEMLTADNLPRLLSRAQVVVDALDRLPTRLVLQRGARSLGIPMIHGSIAGFLGQVMTIFPGDPGLEGLYGMEEDVPEQGIETELGTPAATPMLVAAWEAQEVVKVLLKRGELLRGRLLVIDMETGRCDTLELATGDNRRGR